MPLEFNFPDGDRSGDAGILCIIHAFHWRPDWQRDVTYPLLHLRSELRGDRAGSVPGAPTRGRLKLSAVTYAVYRPRVLMAYRQAVTMRGGCIRMKYSQILYTLLYGEVMYRPPRWTVFETFERLSPR